MAQNKSISVAMCTYNGEKYLAEQLQSIAAQTRLPSELVICDDRSTDTTVAIIKDFAATAPFEVRLIENPQNIGSAKKGVTRNFENVSRLCCGDLIAFCDQDDIWLPQKLARLSVTMEEDHNLGGVFSDARLVDRQSQPTGALLSQTSGFTPQEQARLAQGETLSILLAMTKVYGCTLMVDARLLEKILPVPPSWWFDAWFACTTAVYSRLAFVSEPLFCYRIHPTQQVGAAVPSFAERVRKWRQSAAQYWIESQPQLSELRERLVSQQDARYQPEIQYIEGRMALLKMRSELPANRLMRLAKVLPRVNQYRRYFNGWKSVVKDITA